MGRHGKKDEDGAQISDHGFAGIPQRTLTQVSP